jgi:voltage-gated potassium channel
MPSQTASAIGETADSKLSQRLITWRRWTDVPLIALALGSLPILILEFVQDRLSDKDRTFITIINIMVFLAFAIDYVIELILTGDRKRYLKTEWTSLLIAVSQGLALLPALGILGITRVVRGIRPVLFLWRLFAVGAAEAKELRKTLKTHAVSSAFSVAALVWISSAVAFTIVEDVGEGQRVNSFGDALWWSATTISTVGYGDIYPVTPVGRTIAVFTTIVGVSTFGVVTAKLASVLVKN